MKNFLFVALAFFFFSGLGPFLTPSLAQEDDKTIRLPLPDRAGGLPLNEAQNKRRSHRAFLSQDLTLEQISQILWAAFGVNREAGKMRTIPTSHNRQNILIFAILKSGVWLYGAEQNLLSLQLAGDFTGEYSSAPLTLIYVTPVNDGAIGGLHVGLAAQNVGLTCASLDLANVIKTTKADALKGKLPLPSGYQIIAVHVIGRPDGPL
ncbi:MAG: nitroreductase family protein [Deltaproteobacteria bacterium]|nr:nitroreductase family protein [Deltaproteobacteria bacterium]